MKFLVWNVRGLNDLSKQREVRNMVRRLRVDVVCLIETRVKVEKVDKITEAMLPEWGIFSNYEFNPLGRIWVCWNKEALDIAVLSKSEQDISCRIEDLKMGKVWCQSFIYGLTKVLIGDVCGID